MRNKKNGILAIIALGLLLVFSVSVFAQRSGSEENAMMNTRAQEVAGKNGESYEMMKGNQNMMGMMEMCNQTMSNMEKGSSMCCTNNAKSKQQELNDQEQKENKSDNSKDKSIQQDK